MHIYLYVFKHQHTRRKILCNFKETWYYHFFKEIVESNINFQFFEFEINVIVTKIEIEFFAKYENNKIITKVELIITICWNVLLLYFIENDKTYKLLYLLWEITAHKLLYSYSIINFLLYSEIPEISFKKSG